MKKVSKGHLRFVICLGKTSSAVGPALGQCGLSSQQFYGELSRITGHLKKDMNYPVTVRYYEDSTFDVDINETPTNWVIKAMLARADKQRAGLTLKEIYELAVLKAYNPKFKQSSLQSLCRDLLATCRSLST